MMKEREERWVAIANRLAKRGETQQWYSAVDAATMSTQMSMAASGQVSRGGGGRGGAAAPRAAVRRDQAQRADPARLGPPAGWRRGDRRRRGTGTAVMDRPDGGSSGSATAGAAGRRVDAGAGAGAQAPQDQARQAPALTRCRAGRAD